MEKKILCPYCEGEISATARKCRHCGEWINKEDNASSTTTEIKNDNNNLSNSNVCTDAKGGDSRYTQLECSNINGIILIISLFLFIISAASFMASGEISGYMTSTFKSGRMEAIGAILSIPEWISGLVKCTAAMIIVYMFRKALILKSPYDLDIQKLCKYLAAWLCTIPISFIGTLCDYLDIDTTNLSIGIIGTLLSLIALVVYIICCIKLIKTGVSKYKVIGWSMVGSYAFVILGGIIAFFEVYTTIAILMFFVSFALECFVYCTIATLVCPQREQDIYYCKGLILLLTGLLVYCAFMCVDSSNSSYTAKSNYINGYEITQDIHVAPSNNSRNNTEITIKAGRVCSWDNFTNMYQFAHVDYSEGLDIGDNMVRYYEPAQDYVPERYINKNIFNQSTKKVRIYKDAPSSWKPKKSITLVPKSKSYIEMVKIKPIKIKDDRVVYVIDGNEDNSTYKRETSPMLDETVYEISIYSDSTPYVCYLYKGKEITYNMLDVTGNFINTSYDNFIIGDDGYCYVREYGDNTKYEYCTELSTVVGMYPSFELAGWINSNQMVINDIIFEVVE